MSKLRLEMNLPTDDEIKRMFDAVPILERHDVARKTVKEGAKVVTKRARSLAPRDTKGHGRKRSKKQQGEADWNYPLWKTIKHVVRKYGRGNGAAIIGPEWPKGNKAYFNTSPRGRKQFLWGKRTGRTVPQIRNWIVQAFDETRTEQIQVMKTKLKSLMQEVWE